MDTDSNIRLFPWFKFFSNLNFWQAVWFLYFQAAVGPAEAILLYVVYDMATTVVEVPSGYMSDRFGRRMTLIAAATAAVLGALCLYTGTGFALFALGQALLGAGSAFASGTDSALLYESLAKEGRAPETDRQELRAWRFSFAALAVSALAGGVLTLYDPRWPFALTALSGIMMLGIAFRFTDTKRPTSESGSEREQEALRLSDAKGALLLAFRSPTLLWLFGLAVLMYAYSHLPFVFGQPFIEQALSGLGLSEDVPLVSGAISASMMVISVVASLAALTLRRTLGLPAILLLAFGMQLGLVVALATTANALAILLLLLRMVPDSLSRPFILARIQPLLGNDIRATYLSLQSLAGRVLLSGTLWIAALNTHGGNVLAHGEMSRILWAYAAGGALCLLLLALTARRAQIEG